MTRRRSAMKKLEEYVRCIPDFPEEGVMFRDVTSVLQDADGLHLAIDTMQELIDDWNLMWWSGLNPEDSFSVPPLLIITINPLF